MKVKIYDYNGYQINKTRASDENSKMENVYPKVEPCVTFYNKNNTIPKSQLKYQCIVLELLNFKKGMLFGDFVDLRTVGAQHKVLTQGPFSLSVSVIDCIPVSIKNIYEDNIPATFISL